ncbi:anhydro-N-acetylmuramic acid kinase [Acetobacteraceae bacterium KSS8]|uniref:Anhydro-N-acetylmuramic acid kinase n=1 Tax=Endosaccharibacter trunci TaxID=2812733 RepID=A0ABT1WA78_9PROT|nr:anhydro-N-acetylmuramic acid kinase [Acetobacteraceae bacterium KSS8]
MRRVIGLMSGTSLDGVDAALLETDGVRVGGFGRALTIPYPPRLRADLRDLLDRAADLLPDDPGLLQLERALTLVHAEAVRALGEPAELIGFHGQTILHRPEEGRTWQIGDAVLLSRETGLPVAFDFRSADVAAGGQGAPLVPVFHAALAAALPRPLAVLNLGGVGNLTFIGGDGTLLACDTGPGNALLDDWALRHTGVPCDRDGALALAGHVDERILATLMAHPFFRRPAPKSLDRQAFHDALDRIAVLSPENGAATLAAFTAAAVAATSLPAVPTRWLVCGGGRRNPAIMRALESRLGAPVESVESVGWDGDALEAQCFAFLAERVRLGLPLSFPGTTGVTGSRTGGRMVG